jgi:hypothetical protein
MGVWLGGSTFDTSSPSGFRTLLVYLRARLPVMCRFFNSVDAELGSSSSSVPSVVVEDVGKGFFRTVPSLGAPVSEITKLRKRSVYL